MYTFKRVPRERYDGGCNILNVYEASKDGEAVFPGQAITLFGQPDYFTEDYENIFSMVVEASKEGSEPLYLEIYHGPSGPAIGGNNDEAHKAAAEELAEKIRAAKPSDYDWEGVYEDIPVNIRMGVRNGVPYNESDFPEEFDEDMF